MYIVLPIPGAWHSDKPRTAHLLRNGSYVYPGVGLLQHTSTVVPVLGDESNSAIKIVFHAADELVARVKGNIDYRISLHHKQTKIFPYRSKFNRNTRKKHIPIHSEADV